MKDTWGASRQLVQRDWQFDSAVIARCIVNKRDELSADIPPKVAKAANSLVQVLFVDEPKAGEKITSYAMQQILPVVTEDTLRLPVYYDKDSDDLHPCSKTMLMVHVNKLVTAISYYTVCDLVVKWQEGEKRIEVGNIINEYIKLYRDDAGFQRTFMLLGSRAIFDCLHQNTLKADSFNGEWL